MIQLTKNQLISIYQMLRDNGLTVASSMPKDGDGRWTIDQVGAERLQLVEFGLALIDKSETAQRFSEDIKEEEGRDVMVLQPTKIARAMFKRGACSRAVN